MSFRRIVSEAAAALCLCAEKSARCVADVEQPVTRRESPSSSNKGAEGLEVSGVQSALGYRFEPRTGRRSRPRAIGH